MDLAYDHYISYMYGEGNRFAIHLVDVNYATRERDIILRDQSLFRHS